MPSVTSREWRFRTRPVGEPKPSDFELAKVDIPEPGEGQVQVRNLWMTVDPYMRGRMIGDVCKTFPRKEWPKAIVVEDNCIGSGCELCIQICPFDASSRGTWACGSSELS